MSEAPSPETDARSRETLARQSAAPVRALEPGALCTDPPSPFSALSLPPVRFRSLYPDGMAAGRRRVHSAAGESGLPGGVAGGRPRLASPPRSVTKWAVTRTLN